MNLDVRDIIGRHGCDRSRLIDMLWDVQHRFGHLPAEHLAQLGDALNLSPLDVAETASFYHFFRDRPSGRHQIYLSNTVIAQLDGYAEVHAALERETGVAFVQADPSGVFGLFETACIGLSDQEPAMMVDDVVFTRLTPERVAEIVAGLRSGATGAEIADPAGWPRSDVGYVDALVDANLHTSGPVFFTGTTDVSAVLGRCLALPPEQVTDAVTSSGLRGRGGAGFPAGLKWQLCRAALSDEKYVICNADEGEPGTFKDRVLLTRSPREVLAGMIIAAHAIGAAHGIVYLRAEYWYLKDFLQRQLDKLRDEGWLGAARGPYGPFDIRIQMGAGAYIAGDESALIESCEGKRATPRVKPPFPVTHGYLGHPTCVNNVETFAAAARIMAEGPAWYRAMGTPGSAGTRLLSVAGDCTRPGVHEVEWGITLGEVLTLVGADDARAVQVGGPSGELVSAERDGARKICHEDLACGGAFTVFNSSRDLLRVVRGFMQFFAHESCGICVPCRVGNTVLEQKVDLVMSGRGVEKDLRDMVSWGNVIRATSRCGLGATSPNPILSTLTAFPEIYADRLAASPGPLLPSFDLEGALHGYPDTMADLTPPEVR